tara:strand:- start:208 stop:513 length:306 start_codon:yes stop_codon:yes gene_type:complete
MKKLLVISLILVLILFTALIKNSTKRISDKIFVMEENIRSLKKELDNVRLENDYLSSAEKLLEYQNLYFDDELLKRNINEIKIINKSLEKLNVEQLELIEE